MSRFRGEKKFSLRYAIGELVLITLGIYLAFAVNNWNEGRKELGLEQFYLTNLLADVERSIRQLERHQGLSTSQLEAAGILDGLLAQGSRVDRDSLRSYLNAFNTNPRFRVSNYSYQSLLQSGDYRIIRSDSLRNTLDRYFLELLPGVVTTEGYYLDRLDVHYYPVKESVYMARSNEFININRLFDPVFKDNVFALPAYIRQELSHIKAALEAGYALAEVVEGEIK